MNLQRRRGVPTQQLVGRLGQGGRTLGKRSTANQVRGGIQRNQTGGVRNANNQNNNGGNQRINNNNN